MNYLYEIFSFRYLTFGSFSSYSHQHIEDLTQEKFSLQRALDASRTLSESLAAENSALTESYNQQVIISVFFAVFY